MDRIIERNVFWSTCTFLRRFYFAKSQSLLHSLFRVCQSSASSIHRPPLGGVYLRIPATGMFSPKPENSPPAIENTPTTCSYRALQSVTNLLQWVGNRPMPTWYFKQGSKHVFISLTATLTFTKYQQVAWLWSLKQFDSFDSYPEVADCILTPPPCIEGGSGHKVVATCAHPGKKALEGEERDRGGGNRISAAQLLESLAIKTAASDGPRNNYSNKFLFWDLDVTLIIFYYIYKLCNT